MVKVYLFSEAPDVLSSLSRLCGDEGYVVLGDSMEEVETISMMLSKNETQIAKHRKSWVGITSSK